MQLLAHVSVPFEAALRRRVFGVSTPAEVCTLNVELGHRFTDAVEGVIRAAGLKPDDIDVVGSHGQTVAHLPSSVSAVPSTLQLGESSVIAERTGIPVVCDFRSRDMVAGGEGAPLVPYFDWALFRLAGARRAFLNLGGIANLSVVTDSLQDTVAFDTGPGNMVLDGIVRRITKDETSFDRDGELSRKGVVQQDLLDAMLELPYFTQPPPKSSGRELFGNTLVDWLWSRLGPRVSPQDLLATAVRFTVESTGRAFDQWVLPHGGLEGIYVSGGGSRHPGIVRGLMERLPSVPVRPLGDLGFSEAAKEAACFALLASETLSGVPTNIPRVTGASRAVVLGKIVP